MKAFVPAPRAEPTTIYYYIGGDRLFANCQLLTMDHVEQKAGGGRMLNAVRNSRF